MKNKFAVQLFTVRDEMTLGIRPLFKKLKEMGWSGVEIGAMPDGYDPQEVAMALKENNLKAVGMHVELYRLQTELSQVLQEAELYGTKDIICPYTPAELQSEKGYKDLKKILNEISDSAPGYRIGYHNHDFEFKTQVEGNNALNYLLEPKEDNNIMAEIDVYWVKKAGFDPLEFIKPYTQRMPNLHIKDMSNDKYQTFSEIGEGVIDFKPILRWGEENGVEWYVVEQDVCQRDPLESLEISYRNLMKIVQKV